jgi:hypothetical protein
MIGMKGGTGTVIITVDGAFLVYRMFELSVNSYEIALSKVSVVIIDIFEH